MVTHLRYLLHCPYPISNTLDCRGGDIDLVGPTPSPCFLRIEQLRADRGGALKALVV